MKRMPFKEVVDKFNEPRVDISMRQALKDKFAIYEMIVKQRDTDIPTDYPSLSHALTLLGNAQAAVDALEDVAELIGKVYFFEIGKENPLWPEELYNLQQKNKETLEIAKRVVKAVTHKLIKDQKEKVLTIPGICSIETPPKES